MRYPYFKQPRYPAISVFDASLPATLTVPVYFSRFQIPHLKKPDPNLEGGNITHKLVQRIIKLNGEG
jgi:hypothetical protein